MTLITVTHAISSTHAAARWSFKGVAGVARADQGSASSQRKGYCLNSQHQQHFTR
jgi:hypothetical protein